MTTLTSRQTFFLIALFVVTSLTFIQLDNRRALDPVKTSVNELLQPVTRTFNRVAEGRPNDSALQQQLDQVAAERDALQAENANLRAQVAEVDQLEKQLNLEEAHPTWATVQARVINVDPTNQQKLIIIDKGSRDGIEVGMPVVDPNFYVGQVTEVTENSARITLIIDTSQQVGAKLQVSGADGVVYGEWQRGGRLTMRHVNRDVVPEEGEIVVTSDVATSSTARVPGNLIIGRVRGQPVYDRQSDSVTIEVLPQVNFDDLEIVTVILADEQP